MCETPWWGAVNEPRLAAPSESPTGSEGADKGAAASKRESDSATGKRMSEEADPEGESRRPKTQKLERKEVRAAQHPAPQISWHQAGGGEASDRSPFLGRELRPVGEEPGPLPTQVPLAE